MTRVLRSLIGAALGVALVAALGVGLWAREELAALREPAVDEPATLIVARGTGFGALSRRLTEMELVRYPDILRLYAKLNPEVTRLKAGEYALQPGDSVARILEKVHRGEIMQHPVTVPEGYNLREIAPLLEKAGVAEGGDFLAKATDPGYAAALGVTAPTLEGYLFPDTYHFARDVGADAVIRAMVQRFRQRLPADYAARAAAVGLTLHQAVVLASVVEKETGAAGERPLISAVFHNRLRKKMRLQSDPTVIYGIEGYDGNIRKRDLLAATPYNTYRIAGLPAGPIANPGYDALLAVVDPAPVDYLYFVSRNDGTHYFSSTLKQHNQAVDYYQRRRGKPPAPQAAAAR